MLRCKEMVPGNEAERLWSRLAWAWTTLLGVCTGDHPSSPALVSVPVRSSKRTIGILHLEINQVHSHCANEVTHRTFWKTDYLRELSTFVFVYTYTLLLRLQVASNRGSRAESRSCDVE